MARWDGPRSHRAVRALAESDRDRYAYLCDLNRAIGQLDLEPPVELLPKRGDILFFQHLWVHGAPFNTRPQPRLPCVHSATVRSVTGAGTSEMDGVSGSRNDSLLKEYGVPKMRR